MTNSRAHRAIGSALLFGCALFVPAVAEAKFVPGYVPKVRTWFAYGLRYTHPQEAAASFALMRARETDTGLVSGWFVQAEPGLGGGKLSIGAGGLGHGDHSWLPPMFGFAIKASVMRTWGTPEGLPADQTLLGPELDVTFAYVKLSAGYLWRIGGAAGQSGTFTWGAGIGF